MKFTAALALAFLPLVVTLLIYAVGQVIRTFKEEE